MSDASSSGGEVAERADRMDADAAVVSRTRPILELRDVCTHYGPIQVLRNISLEIHPGEIVCLLGGNASGKTTTLKTILGYVVPSQGDVLLDGQRVNGLETQRLVDMGISMVPENRRLFRRMTVWENLELGSCLRQDRDEIEKDFKRVFTLFPRVKERLSQRAGTLSGGEQQMVAMGRALMSQPKLLLMDEPSMGLAPILVERNFEIIKQVHEAGVAVLVVEQNANVSLSIADRGYVLQTGQVVLSGPAHDLRENEELKKAYLGR
jgi:branched-chain amino acid transport system ATP-binding protein